MGNAPNVGHHVCCTPNTLDSTVSKELPYQALKSNSDKHLVVHSMLPSSKLPVDLDGLRTTQDHVFLLDPQVPVFAQWCYIHP